VLENRFLRRIFGPKTDEVTGEWRRLHNEKLYDLIPHPTKYYMGDPIKNNEMDRECGTYGKQETCIQGTGGET